MYLEWGLLLILGAVAGAATAAGTFALLVKLGVVPRMLAAAHVAQRTMTCETAIMAGAFFGCLLSLGRKGEWLGRSIFWDASFCTLWPVAACAFVVLLGLGAGIFVGCQAMALAEILNMFPILFRRLKLQMGLPAMVLSLALGKTAGSLCYFWFLEIFCG